MRVLCIACMGADLPALVLGLTRNLPTSKHDLTVGNEYVVYSICTWAGGTLHYLVIDDSTGRPSWHPADLFTVEDGSIPDSWRYGYKGYSADGSPRPILAVWGYPEMLGPAHHDDLQDRESEAMHVFALRKTEIDRRESMRCSEN